MSACASAEPPHAATQTLADSAPPSAGMAEGGDADPHASASSDDPLADAFVAAHDQVRASVSPPADPPLPSLAWSPELAATAQAWAERCDYQHGQGDYGENLAARTDQGGPDQVVGAWASEAEHYDYRTNRCARGEVCGHYTQIVWRDSATIGCGVARCETGSPFGGGAWWFYVCNYAPPGNYKGEKPY